MQLNPPSPSEIKTGYDAIVWIAFTFLGFSLLLNGWFLRSAADKLTTALEKLSDHETRLSIVESTTVDIKRFWEYQVERGYGRREEDNR